MKVEACSISNGPVQTVESDVSTGGDNYGWWLRMKSTTGFGSLRDNGK